jgi:flagellar hook-associated protein 1 FlgK
LALDKLSELVKISYTEESNGIVTVKAEGIPFVTSDAVFYMETAELSGAEGSNYVTAVWPQLGGTRVFNLTEELSTAKNNDIGKLKG